MHLLILFGYYFISISDSGGNDGRGNNWFALNLKSWFSLNLNEMGIISDIFEDNAELSGQILAPNNVYIRDFSNLEKQIQVQKCPFCFKGFPISELNNHYQSSHGQEHCYIRLNGSIIRDIGWAENGISSIELGLLGYEEVEVKVICGNFTQTFSTNADLDILTRIPLNFEGEIRIDINPSHSSSKIFLIYCKSILKFRRNDLDNLILQMQRELENTTTSLDLGSWKSKFKQISPVNVLERRYFNGFYEYALGSYLEKNDRYKEAKQHFEDAFGLVAPFKTNLARTASRVLGLKMNCFAFFEGCSQNSPFASADAFFNKALNPDEVSFVRVEPSKLGIFIDRFSHLFLDSLFSFYNKVDQQFPILLDALQRDFLSKEKNNADKLTLLKARYYKYQKQITKADVEYSLLEYHPIFGEEAKLYLQCRTKIQ